MKQPKYSPNILGEIMQKCWQKNPKERPTFSQLAEKIENYVEILTSSSYLNMPCGSFLSKEIDEPSPTIHLEIEKMLSKKSQSEETDVPTKI